MLRTQLFIIFFLFFYTFNSYASDKHCGYACLSPEDQQGIKVIRSTLTNSIGSFNAFPNELRQTPKGNYLAASLIHKRMGDKLKDTANELNKTHKITGDPNLKFFYLTLEGIFVELADTLLVGAALLDAKSRDSTKIKVGLIEFLVTTDVKRLTTPIASKIELNNRIDSFTEILEQRFPLMIQTFQGAAKRLYKKTGIKF